VWASHAERPTGLEPAVGPSHASPRGPVQGVDTGSEEADHRALCLEGTVLQAPCPLGPVNVGLHTRSTLDARSSPCQRPFTRLCARHNEGRRPASAVRRPCTSLLSRAASRVPAGCSRCRQPLTPWDLRASAASNSPSVPRSLLLAQFRPGPLETQPEVTRHLLLEAAPLDLGRLHTCYV
jgi:hypothetical protein